MLETLVHVIAVFLAFAVLDFAWARYTLAAADGKSLKAAMWAMTLPLLGLVGTIHVIEHSLWYVLPMAAGSFLGTYIALKRSTRRQPNEQSSGESKS